MKTTILILPLLMCACTSSKAWLVEKEEKTHLIECWTWGQATCALQDPEDESLIIIAESKGLSDNGVIAIVRSITELPEAIVGAIFPVGKVVDAIIPEGEK